MHGYRNDELMVRWLQYGVFSPINRLHSTKNPFWNKEPWEYDAVKRDIMDHFLRLRHQTVGYDKLGMLVATDTDTGEKTRIQIRDRVSVSVVGEDVKAATGTKRPAPKPAAKSGTVSTLPARRRPQQ